MNQNQAAAFVFAQAVDLNARIAGMVAENMQRQLRGESMAFTQIEFEAVIREYTLGYNDILKLYSEASTS